MVKERSLIEQQRQIDEIKGLDILITNKDHDMVNGVNKLLKQDMLLNFKDRIDFIEKMKGKTLYSSIEYINEIFTNSLLSGKVTNMFSEMFLNEEITIDAIQQYLDNLNWLGYLVTSIFAASLDLKSIRLSKNMEQIRDKMLKDNKEAIDNNDIVKFNIAEKEILGKLKEDLKETGTQGAMIYSSGTGKVDVNYKVTSLFRGGITQADDPIS